jgi:enterobactin synthetase component D
MMDISIPHCSIHFEPLPLDSSIDSQMQSWLSDEHAKFGQKRKHDFLGGRYCAIMACDKIGHTLTSLPIGPHRNPIWPKTITGSITHSKNFVMAVVSTFYKSIGVDVESLMSEERYQNIKRMIVNSMEEDLINQNLHLYPTLVFSAKESLYKAINPLCETFFGFHEAQVLEIYESELKIELLGNLEQLRPFAGFYTISYRQLQDSVMTWLTIKHN